HTTYTTHFFSLSPLLLLPPPRSTLFPYTTLFRSFSSRGGILDFYSPSGRTDGVAHPVRVEFFGDTIDSIREFDPETQRSVREVEDRKSTRLNSSHVKISYAVFCLKKKRKKKKLMT